MKEIRITPENAHAIATGKICPYCGKKTRLENSSSVYNGRSYGLIYICKPCDAFVGIHKDGSNRALGRLANADLRHFKKEAHAWFDPIWQAKVKLGQNKFQARTGAYTWLSTAMGIDRNDTHIGMFDIDQCKLVIDLCKKYYAQESINKLL